MEQFKKRTRSSSNLWPSLKVMQINKQLKLPHSSIACPPRGEDGSAFDSVVELTEFDFFSAAIGGAWT